MLHQSLGDSPDPVSIDALWVPIGEFASRQEGCGVTRCTHVPEIDGDADRAQSFAFAFGYIKALIAAVSAGVM